MGAPPPGDGRNDSVRVAITLSSRITRKKRDDFFTELNKKLDSYVGNPAHRATYSVWPDVGPQEGYVVYVVNPPLSKQQAKAFAQGYKEIRAELEEYVKDQDAYVDEWNDVVHERTRARVNKKGPKRRGK